jgi:2-iminobutanoate/2-iminopropanoate deaminase
MFTRTEINTFHLSTAVAAYSEVVRAGEFLFLSGAGPVDESGAVVGEGIEQQTRFTMEMLNRNLQASGGSFANVVKFGVFLASMDDFPAFDAVYCEFIERPFPARTVVAARELWGGILIEADLVAYVGP